MLFFKFLMVDHTLYIDLDLDPATPLQVSKKTLPTRLNNTIEFAVILNVF